LPSAFPRSSSRAIPTGPKVPLKLGIAKDIIARCPDLEQHAIHLMLQRYMGGPKYLTCLIEGAPRHNLDGLTAGWVEAGAARRAAIGLARLVRTTLGKRGCKAASLEAGIRYHGDDGQTTLMASLAEGDQK
jgi:ProP effector